MNIIKSNLIIELEKDGVICVLSYLTFKVSLYQYLEATFSFTLFQEDD